MSSHAADPHPGTPAEADDQLSLDVLFDVLRNERRRRVLRQLHEADGPVAFGDLVDHVAAAEHDGEARAVDSGTRKAVYTSLYQSHLPKLEDCGVIVYDRQSGPVEGGPSLDAVIDCLNAVERKQERYASGGPARGLASLRAAVGL